MSRWLAIKGPVLPGDVVRWVEVIWQEKGRGKRKKPVKVGARDMTAQIKADEGRGFLALVVIRCEIISSAWEPLRPLKQGEKIRRKRSTLEKGTGHRMAWSDETARAVAVSKFLG